MEKVSKEEGPRNKCPIPDTHARISQVFLLFQNILHDYQDELKFTSTLNNIIQNLRNVTFILQKELSHTQEFAKWYAHMQKKMKDDNCLKWLHNARTHVVHIGDLKKKSYAKVRLKDHFDHELVVMELNPMLSTQDIANDFCKKIDLKIPDNLLEQTIIEVERVWIVDEYPEAEVIDILIYCFGFLTDLVYKAHEELLETNALLCKQNIHVDPAEDFMSSLHNVIKRGRVTRIHYKTKKIYKKFSNQTYRPDNQTLEKARKRYGDQKYISSLMDISKVNLPFNNMRYHIEMAKHLFNTDGHLIPMAFLYFPDRLPMHVVLGLDDQASKYLIFEHLAEKVEETGCQALVIVSETWGGDMPTSTEEYIPAYIQRKKEFICIIGASPEKTQDYQIEIVRSKDGNIKFKKEEEVVGGIYPSLDRIYRVWGINKNSSSKP